MAECSVVDTNVLIVASAADDGSPFQPDATPVEVAALRDEVLTWLRELEDDANRCVVLDWDWHICGEYQNKLDQSQDYGWLAMMSKVDRNEVVWVGIEVDGHGHAKLPAVLRKAVTDMADRKMVAAALAANGFGHKATLVNACDTDWLDCGQALADANIAVHHLLHDWLHARHARKGKRGA